MKSCVSEQFTGQDYANKLGKSDSIDCGDGQCCIYQSTSLDDTNQNCLSCANAATNDYTRDWSGVTEKTPSIVFTGSEGKTITLPYCNDAKVTTPQNNHQGVAISLQNAETNPNASQFGDPQDCLPGGKFSGQCQGMTGCSGTWGEDNLELASAPCRLGFSTSTGSGPASNCPNIYTIQNSGAANDCKFSTKPASGAGLRDICQPANAGRGGNCQEPDLDAMHLTDSDGGWPRIKSIELPEGAWVTAYDNYKSTSAQIN